MADSGNSEGSAGAGDPGGDEATPGDSAGDEATPSDSAGDESDNGRTTAESDPAVAGVEAEPETALSDEVAPTDVFALLANETRLGVVRELAKHRWDNWALDGLTFAELRRAVGERDAGNFSYHLEKLVGVLVFRLDEEYVLNNRGLELAGAVEAETFTSGGEPRRGELPYDCPHGDCDRSMEAAYTEQYFRMYCPDHDVISGATLSPGLAEHATLEELVEISVLENRQNIQRARAGVCPLCSGPMETTLPVEDPEAPERLDVEIPEGAVFAGFTCEQCEMSFHAPPGTCIVDHPAVVALFHEHDRDIRAEPWSELAFVGVHVPDVESTDPVRVRIDVEAGDDTLSLWLDGDASVVDTRRE